MCYDNHARPPYPPIAGGTAMGEDIVLTAADGNRFAAYVAHAGDANGAQILIYPDVRGLHTFYKELALRFAEVGVTAIAMDYFGRTAGLTARDDAFEFWPHVQQIRLAGVFADARASIAHLRQGAGATRAMFVCGFCMGGSLSLYTGAEDFGLAGIIPFYSGMSRKLDEQKGTALDVAPRVKVPVLGLFGGADQGIPPEQVAALDAALDGAGVQHEIVTYPGAPHSFFDRRATDFAEASADAWTRMLGFIKTHSK
ncbi:MAG: dienelactone hydrolase family protein [Chloroflexota bacterium]